MPQDLAMPVTNTMDQVKERKQDTLWMLSIYGTGIGAGTLFLPIDAGVCGILPLIIMALLAFPITYLPHRALCRFVLSGHSASNDYTDVVEEHFGKASGNILTLLYFCSIYPILLMYSVAITNTTASFMTHQLGLTAPPRMILSFILIFGLMAIVRFGQDIILRSISFLVYPFITVLMLLSLSLIPHWSNAFLTQGTSVAQAHGSHSLLMTLWLLIPLMVFSFSHTPIISPFAVSQKQQFGDQAEKRCSRILKYSHLMMVGTVMFFVFSCVLSLSPHDLAIAKQQNISILSYLANHFQTPVMTYIAPLSAFMAISKSFLGHYLGAREGMRGILVKSLRAQGKTAKDSTLKHVIELFMLVTCWITATLNPNILKMIETLNGPIIAIILYLMPMYAIIKIPALKKYQQPFSTAFVILIGVIALSAILYGLFGQ